MPEVLIKFIVSLLDFAVVAIIPLPSCDTEEEKERSQRALLPQEQKYSKN